MNLTTLATFTQFGRVFPLNPLTKEPFPKFRWKRWSTVDLQTINQWLTEYPQCNWALVPDRAFVVDVDIKGGATGPESVEAVGGLDPTFTVGTPSGGSHHYYAPDPDVPFKTSNGWLPGVDIRYGGDGYVVLPYSTTEKGKYVVEVDLEQLDSVPLAARPSGSLLSPIPDWIKTRLMEEPLSTKKNIEEPFKIVQGTLSDHSISSNVSYQDVTSPEWKDIRDRIRYLFFRNKRNAPIWRYQSARGMVDHSQSGFEWQLACRLMNVGATDEEIITVYRVWCNKHRLKIKQERFVRQIIPKARIETSEYVEKWKASQPVRRKVGTTKNQIIEAISWGCERSVEIEKFTGLKGSAVRMHLKRMLAAGKLVKDSSGYAIASDSRPVAGLEVA